MRRAPQMFAQMRSVWLPIILCLGQAIPTYADTIFTEDYEVATITDLASKGWGVDTVNCWLSYCSQDIVTSPVHGGSHALRNTYIGVQDGSYNSKIYRYFPATPEIYGRYYLMVAPIYPAMTSQFNPQGEAKQHYLKVDQSSIDGTPNAVIVTWWGQKMLVFAPQVWADCDPTVGCPVENPNAATVLIQDNQWYCVEYHLKMNTPGVADGVEEFWVNGTLTTGRYDRKMRDLAHASSQFTNIEVYRQTSTDMYRYEDDFVLATTRVGCLGTPPPSDITPPAAPRGLKLL